MMNLGHHPVLVPGVVERLKVHEAILGQNWVVTIVNQRQTTAKQPS
jgi:hypothetical protein